MTFIFLFNSSYSYHQTVPEEVPELEIKATYGLASPVNYEAPAKSKEWTSEVYAGFKVSTQNPTEKVGTFKTLTSSYPTKKSNKVEVIIA